MDDDDRVAKKVESLKRDKVDEEFSKKKLVDLLSDVDVELPRGNQDLGEGVKFEDRFQEPEDLKKPKLEAGWLKWEESAWPTRVKAEASSEEWNTLFNWMDAFRLKWKLTMRQFLELFNCPSVDEYAGCLYPSMREVICRFQDAEVLAFLHSCKNTAESDPQKRWESVHRRQSQRHQVLRAAIVEQPFVRRA